MRQIGQPSTCRPVDQELRVGGLVVVHRVGNGTNRLAAPDGGNSVTVLLAPARHGDHQVGIGKAPAPVSSMKGQFGLTPAAS